MTQYDQIGAAFEQTKEMPVIKLIERPSVLRSLEHIRGKHVLDLACGTGYYSRIIRQLGAVEVVGVDISEAMIKRAVEIETTTPLGITYYIMDATELPVLGSFDRVNAIYLLNYAPNEAALRKMAKSIHQNLTPGGDLFAWTVNPDYSFEDVNTTRKYGATFTLVQQFDEGRELTCKIHTDIPIAFNTYMLTRETYERAILAAGFQEFSWTPISISEDARTQFSSHYWDDLLANPPFIELHAR